VPAGRKRGGIVWLSDDSLPEIGCACEIDRVRERMEHGRTNVLARGTRPFRVLERVGRLAYPAVEAQLWPRCPRDRSGHKAVTR
jgi:Lon protease-like protein